MTRDSMIKFFYELLNVLLFPREEFYIGKSLASGTNGNQFVDEVTSLYLFIALLVPLGERDK